MSLVEPCVWVHLGRRSPLDSVLCQQYRLLRFPKDVTEAHPPSKSATRQRGAGLIVSCSDQDLERWVILLRIVIHLFRLHLDRSKSSGLGDKSLRVKMRVSCGISQPLGRLERQCHPYPPLGWGAWQLQKKRVSEFGRRLLGGYSRPFHSASISLHVSSGTGDGLPKNIPEKTPNSRPRPHFKHFTTALLPSFPLPPNVVSSYGAIPPIALQAGH